MVCIFGQALVANMANKATQFFHFKFTPAEKGHALATIEVVLPVEPLLR